MAIIYENPRDLHELASFLVQLNNMPSHHIGFCGQEKEEIYDTLHELNAESAFVCAYKEQKLIGAIGLDIYDSNEEAEVWGPFIHVEEDSSWEHIAEALIAKLTAIHKLHFFINIKNTRAIRWLNTKRAVNKGNYAILKMSRDQARFDDIAIVQPFTPLDEDAFSQLHTFIFPNTYYSAADMIKNINHHRQLLLIKNSSSLIGYVYFEADPKHGEGSIEYIAISPDHQKKGYGTMLIQTALLRLFSFPSITEITLCVNEDNRAAIKLYVAAGFKLEHMLESYQLIEEESS
ncbi:GNAT family N-acetyltransferase [Cytobacillus gottheilii]|uniref:GNAT family N-acetyltransferase n=1 Tax=Cytobacillus gottheilii TaxID=859144 RepID=UPI0024940CCC|nr:N-acetyltransferase [Cytobacillus gottheilii]